MLDVVEFLDGESLLKTLKVSDVESDQIEIEAEENVFFVLKIHKVTIDV